LSKVAFGSFSITQSWIAAIFMKHISLSLSFYMKALIHQYSAKG
jgi:hypothetical protein